MGNAAIQGFEEEFVKAFIDSHFRCAFGFLNVRETDLKQVNNIEALLDLISKSKFIKTGHPKFLEIEVISTFRGFKEAFFTSIIYRKLKIRKLIVNSKELEEKYKWAYEVFKNKYEEYVDAFINGELKSSNSTNKRQTIADKKLDKELKKHQLKIPDYLSLIEHYSHRNSSFDDNRPSDIVSMAKNKKEERNLFEEIRSAFFEGFRPKDQYYEDSPSLSEKRLLKALKKYFKVKNEFKNYSDLEFDNFSVSFVAIEKILRDMINNKLEGKEIANAQKARADMLLGNNDMKKQFFADKYNVSVKSLDSKTSSALSEHVSKEIIKRKICFKLK